MLTNKHSGFTLIEITVVIFIMGLALSFALPRLMSLEAVELKASCRRLSGTMRYLVDQAAYSKTLYLLRIDPAAGTYWVEYCLPEKDPPHAMKCWDDRSTLGKKVRLPAGIRIVDVVLADAAMKEDDAGSVAIPFFPDGFVFPALIHMHDQRDRKFTLQLNPVTGKTLVLDGYAEARPHAPG